MPVFQHGFYEKVLFLVPLFPIAPGSLLSNCLEIAPSELCMQVHGVGYIRRYSLLANMDQALHMGWLSGFLQWLVSHVVYI